MTPADREKTHQALIDLDAGTITKEDALRIFIDAGSDPEDAADIIEGESDCVEVKDSPKKKVLFPRVYPRQTLSPEQRGLQFQQNTRLASSHRRDHT